MKLIFPLPDGERKAVAFATAAYDELTPKGLDASAMLTWLLALYRADMLSTVFGRDPQSVIDVNRRVEALGAIFSRALS